MPTYRQIGILAPIHLIGLRLLQAMGLGGEWGGAVLLVSESAPAKRRGLLGSLVQVGNRSAASSPLSPAPARD